MWELVRAGGPFMVPIILCSIAAVGILLERLWTLQRKRVLPALPDSYEALFHECGVPSFFLTWDHARAADVLRERRLERAIGVVYRPESERLSHYFYASLPQQFDAVIHLDRTTALTPLDRPAAWVGADAPETYPSGF